MSSGISVVEAEPEIFRLTLGRAEITFEVFVDMEPMCLRRGIVDFKDHIKPNILTIHDEHPSMVKARELLKELYQVDELDTSALDDIPPGIWAVVLPFGCKRRNHDDVNRAWSKRLKSEEGWEIVQHLNSCINDVADSRKADSEKRRA